MKNILLVLILFKLTYSFASDRKGNGGDAIVCRENGKITEVLFYDLYEAQEKRGVVPNIGDNSEDYKVKIDRILNRIKSKDPNRAALYKTWWDTFLDPEVTYFSENILNDIPDAGDTIIPQGCELEQLVQFHRDILPGERQFYIRSDLWNKMDNINKAAMVIHEFIYRELSFYNGSFAQVDSRKARYFNSSLFALSDKPTDKDYFLPLFYSGFEKSIQENYTYIFYNRGYYNAKYSYMPEFSSDGKLLSFRPEFKNCSYSHSFKLYSYKIKIASTVAGADNTCFSNLKFYLNKKGKISKIIRQNHENPSGRDYFLMESSNFKVYSEIFELHFDENGRIQKVIGEEWSRISLEDTMSLSGVYLLSKTGIFNFNRGHIVGEYKIWEIEETHSLNLSGVKLDGLISYIHYQLHKKYKVFINKDSIVEKICIVNLNTCFTDGEEYNLWFKDVNQVIKAKLTTLNHSKKKAMDELNKLMQNQKSILIKHRLQGKFEDISCNDFRDGWRTKYICGSELLDLNPL